MTEQKLMRQHGVCRTVLTVAIIQQIWTMHHQGLTTIKIAQALNVGVETVRKVLRGETFRWVQPIAAQTITDDRIEDSLKRLTQIMQTE